MTEPAVRCEVDGRIAIITINRPEARNAINRPVARGIEAAIDRIEDDPDVWIGILAGEGQVFCAGADLKAIASGDVAGGWTKRGGFGGITKRDRKKPVIAAVDGPALAGGCEIVLACDLVVASRRASFGLPEVKRSLVAAGGGLFRLPRAIPKNIALEIALTGEPIDAERAHAHGLVNRLVEPGDALPHATRLAELICGNAPLAVQGTRRVMLGSLGSDDDIGWELSLREFEVVRHTEDFNEGPRAFVEKRHPVWTGR
jgi:enoyl-CoA hydratase